MRHDCEVINGSIKTFRLRNSRSKTQGFETFVRFSLENELPSV